MGRIIRNFCWGIIYLILILGYSKYCNFFSRNSDAFGEWMKLRLKQFFQFSLDTEDTDMYG